MFIILYIVIMLVCYIIAGYFDINRHWGNFGAVVTIFMFAWPIVVPLVMFVSIACILYDFGMALSEPNSASAFRKNLRGRFTEQTH